MRLTPMAEPLLSVRGLQTHFITQEGTIRAVDGVDFDVFEGRTLGLVGESGCGKSVTARSVLGIVEAPGKVVGGQMLLRTQAGEAVELSKLAPDSAAYRAIRGPEIALIFQEPMASFSQYYTIGNQIMESVRLHMGMDKRAARARAIELLDMVGVPQPSRRVDEYPFELSGGLRQRVMIAMALSCDPRILFADEPTTALDVTTQAQILDLLRDLQNKRGLAIVLITHDMGVIAEMAHDVSVMYLGRAVETGPVADI
ncbi:MAG: ABC transporter ATP-binding protein, partial [Devosia sp.]|nr:ABC transporter ATP-binding protein [Devosia sp.]